MAKQRYGINDGYRGTVGTVIGYQWRGKWCLRSRPRFVRNPRTERQQHNRAHFRAVVRFAASIKQTLRFGLHAKALEAHMTECNLFAHLNKECFSLSGEGRLEVDYEALVVAQGPVAPVGFGEVEATAGAVNVAFEKNPLHVRAEGVDEVYLFALCPSLEASLLSAPVYRRSKHIAMALPDEWAGYEVHFYGFVADYAGRASVSEYLGCGTVGMAPDCVQTYAERSEANLCASSISLPTSNALQNAAVNESPAPTVSTTSTLGLALKDECPRAYT